MKKNEEDYYDFTDRNISLHNVTGGVNNQGERRHCGFHLRGQANKWLITEACRGLFMTKRQEEIVGLTGTSRGRERGLVGRAGVGTKVSSFVVCQRLTGPASKGTEQSWQLVPPALGPLMEHQPTTA